MLRKNRSLTLIACGLLIFSMFFCTSFAYASWSTSLGASGKVAASGNFDVYFGTGASAYYANNTSLTTTATNISSVVISNNGAANNYDTLTVDIKVPTTFTSGTFKVKVYNNSTVSAIASVASTSSNGTPFSLSTTPVTLNPNSVGELTITLTKSGTITAGTTYSGINIVLNYVQPTVNDAPSAAHSH